MGANRHAKVDTIEYRLLLLVCFIAFLAVAIAARLMPWRWQIFGGQGTLGRSIFDEALSRAHATAPYAFMC
jgi:hypothetical protein